MKSNVSIKFLGTFYHKVTAKELKARGVDKDTIKAVKKEFWATMDRAKDIGKANLIGSYVMAAYFIALNRKTGMTPDECYDVFSKALLGSPMFAKTMGDAESYFDPKRTAKRKVWSKESHLRKYENDWVVDILDKTDTYELGYDYTECGVCKLCRDEGCFELAKYLCKLDFPMADMMGMHLERTKTLADGDEVCDFRYSYKK